MGSILGKGFPQAQAQGHTDHSTNAVVNYYFHNIVIYFPASEHSLVLKEIEVPLWNNDNCNGALQGQFGPAYNLPSTTLCAGAEGRDACDVSKF